MKDTIKCIFIVIFLLFFTVLFSSCPLFPPEKYIITASTGTNGTIDPSGKVIVDAGESQTFTITPDSDATIDSVMVDGVNQGAISSYTFTNIEANHSINATFGALADFSLYANNVYYYGQDSAIDKYMISGMSGNYFLYINFTTSGYDAVVEIRNSSGTLMGSWDSNSNGCESGTLKNFSGTYYIWVKDYWGGSLGNYYISLVNIRSSSSSGTYYTGVTNEYSLSLNSCSTYSMNSASDIDVFYQTGTYLSSGSVYFYVVIPLSSGLDMVAAILNSSATSCYHFQDYRIAGHPEAGSFTGVSGYPIMEVYEYDNPSGNTGSYVAGWGKLF